MRQVLISILEKMQQIYFGIAYILVIVKKCSRKNYTVILDVCRVAKGSYGDEALIAGMITAEKEDGSKIIVCEYLNNVGRSIGIDEVKYEPIKYWGFPYKLLSLIAMSKKVIIIGADVIDGAYGDKIVIWDFLIAFYANKLNVDVVLSSFSYSCRVSALAQRKFKLGAEYITYNLRDIYSAQRLMHDINNKRVNCFPDVAFCMNKHVTERTKNIVNAFKTGNRKVIGINVNALPFSSSEQNVLYRVWHSVAASLSREGYNIVFVPHDLRNPFSDLQTIHRILQHGKIPNCYIIDTLVSSAETKAIISELDFLITGRMHAGVAALSTGTPCAIMDYNNKVHGLLDWFELDKEYAISKEEVLDEKKLKTHILRLLENSTVEKEQIEANREKIIEMAKNQRMGK